MIWHNERKSKRAHIKNKLQQKIYGSISKRQKTQSYTKILLENEVDDADFLFEREIVHTFSSLCWTVDLKSNTHLLCIV